MFINHKLYYVNDGFPVNNAWTAWTSNRTIPLLTKREESAGSSRFACADSTLPLHNYLDAEAIRAALSGVHADFINRSIVHSM